MALGTAIGLGAASAHAVTFADYGATSSDPNIMWTQSTNLLSGTLATTGDAASADTTFSFLTPTLAALSDLPALFTMTAAGSADDPAVISNGQVTQPNLTGTFSFIYEGSTPLVVGSKTFTKGANLLSGSFAGADIVGSEGGSTGSLQDAIISGGTVTYSSDFVAFATTGDKGLSVEMTSVLPSLNAAVGNALSSFTAVSTGSFAASIAGGGGGGVPEPATWAAMLFGFGGIGLAMRRGRKVGNIPA